jgi:ABC-type branched-subunit amino acid transport system substrate-binding protein
VGANPNPAAPQPVTVPPDPRQALLGRVRAAFFEEGPAAAIVVIDRAALAEGRTTEAAEVDALMREMISTETDMGCLAAAAERLEPASPWALPVAERRLSVACRGSRHEACLQASRQLAALAMAQRRVAVRELNVGGQTIAFEAFEKVETRVVGVLLPLSGPHAQLGQAAERAIRLAFEAYGGISLRVRDTAGDAAIAEQMARELVFVERVGAILGPIGRQEVARSAAVTRAFGIPHVVLASQLDPEVALVPTASPPTVAVVEPTPALMPGAGVLAVDPAAPPPLPDDTAVRVRTSPEEVAVAVARQAMMGLALTRLAVLRPSNPAAERVAEAFKAEVVRLGGTITDEVAYDPEFKDFKPFAEALLAASVAAMPKSGRRRNPAPLNPLFQGLFIPDAAPRVRKLLPFLEFAGVRFRRAPGTIGVQLFGVSGFHQPTLIDRGDGLTDNAIFADTWFESPDDPRAADFGKRFFAMHGQKAAPFHAEVFDAASVLADAVIGVLPGDHTVRGIILKRLVQAAPRAGVTGVIAFAANEATPRVKLLTVHGETIRERVSEDEERFLRTAPAATEEGR